MGTSNFTIPYVGNVVMNIDTCKKRFFIGLVSLLWMAVAALSSQALADDTEIYTDLETCDVSPPQKYRFIFIVDNSGSMDGSEFAASKATIDAAADALLNGELNDTSDPDDMKIAIVQYGTIAYDSSWNQVDPVQHLYDVTVPFSDDVGTLQSWGRQYGYNGSGVVAQSGEDHQPATLAKMRADNVYASGGALDVSDATNVQFVFFTDAWRDSNSWSWCCSDLVDTGIHSGGLSIYPGFGEYNALKDGSVLPNDLKAQFTILHVPPNSSAGAAAAAIASPGGDYVGSVEYNSGDPEGPGTTPRRYVQGTFDATDDAAAIVELLEQVTEEIRDFTFTQVAPAVSVNAFNRLRHRSEIYYSVFEPSQRPRWGGNVKRFKIVDNQVVDVNNNKAIDPSTGAIAADAKSYWTDGAADGVDVHRGGFRGELTNERTVYTEPHAFETPSGTELVQVGINDEISYASLGLHECPKDDDSDTAEYADASYEGREDVSDYTWTTMADGVVNDGVMTATGGGSFVVEYYANTWHESRFIITNANGDEIIDARNQLPWTWSTRTITLDMETIIDTNPGFDDYGNEYSVELQFYGATEYWGPWSYPPYFEYEIAYTSEPAPEPVVDDCPLLRQQLLGWLEGRDMFNEFTQENASDTTLTSNEFAADPLHTRPFVITFEGTSEANSEDVLFEADNLGILRAIDTSNGEEIWSFIPEKHLDNIKRYAYDQANEDKAYGLDGHISIVQREADSSSASSFSLKDVDLYVGERRGGNSYYSIDVTDAHLGNKPNLNWSIEGGTGDFSDLGQSWSAMIPTKVFSNCPDDFRDCPESGKKETLIFTGGYDIAYDTAGALPSGTTGNAIYMVDVATGDLLWSAGNNTDGNTGHTHDLHLPIGHAMPASPTLVDINGDGSVDIIFAIDISGAIWRVDFDSTKIIGSSGFATGGKVADLSTDGQRHFYAPVDVSRSNPSSGVNRFVLSVGSGYRAHPNDTSDSHNRIYIVFDPYTNVQTSVPASYRYKYADNFTDEIDHTNLADITNLSQNSVNGYYLDLDDGDEKVFESTLTYNGVIIATAFIPGSANDGTCGTGSGKAYFIDFRNRELQNIIELDAPGIPPKPEPPICVDVPCMFCIGTQCDEIEEPSYPEGPDGEESEPGEDPCEDATFSSDLGGAMGQAGCGIEMGRAYRSFWRANRYYEQSVAE